MGLSFGSGPCLASCGPLLITYLAATKKDIAKSIRAYILFSLSRLLVYLALSLVIFFFSQAARYFLGSSVRYLFTLGGLFIIAIGLLIMLGRNLNYKICRAFEGFFLKHDAKTVIIFGLVVGILPCAPFISIVSYIGLISKHWLNSLLYAIAFGLGTVFSPLFILAIFAGFIPKILNQEKVYRIFNFICGLIILFLGFQLLRRAF